jgi:hypothetical protein
MPERGTMPNKVELINPDTGELNIEYAGTIESVSLYNYLASVSTTNHASRVAALEEAMKIGGHALGLNTTSVLITEIERNLESRLGTIRQIYEKKKSDLRESAKAGTIAEMTYEEALKKFSDEMNFNDLVRPTGTNSQDGLVKSSGDRKLGDIEILINNSELVIAVESKYTSSGPSMGDTSLKASYKKLTIDDHARGQVRGAQANRGSHYAIFITKPGSDVAKNIKSNLYVDYSDMAIYVVADIETGDFQSLKIAYMLARSLTLSLTWPVVQQHHLRSVAALLVRSANKLASYESKLKSLETSGIQIAATAKELVSDYSADKEAIKTVLDYLEQVSNASNEEALALKVREIELLTNEKLAIKEVKSAEGS